MKLWVYYVTSLLAIMLAWTFEVLVEGSTIQSLLCLILASICCLGADIINAIKENN